MMRTVCAVILLLTLAMSPAAAQQTIRVGSAVDGILADRDTTLDSGEYYDSYVLDGRAGQIVTLRLTSSEFDPYVMIRGEGGFSEENDDISASDRNAQLVVRLPATGRYRIIATSYQRGERGRYRLAVQPGGTVAASTGNNAGTVRPGQTVEGRLQSGDQTISSGEYIDNWTLEGRRGDSFEVTMSSTEFDSYLIVRGPGGLSQDNDDEDNRGSRNARLRVTLPADGAVRIGATSFRAGETGRYSLSVRALEQDAPPVPVVANAPSADNSVRPGMRVAGNLTSSDRQLSSGEYADYFTLDGRAGQRVELRLDSSEFDPFVQVNGPGSFVESNDDDPAGGRNSRLTVTLPTDGRYTVMVTSYAARETGQYELRIGDAVAGVPSRDMPVARSEPSTRDPDSDRGEALLLTLGGSADGTLSAGDEQLRSTGEYFDTYRFTGERGQRIAIDIESTEFDTYAILQPPGNADQIDNDDGPRGTNARIDQVLPVSGEYRLLVTSFRPGETGAYRVTLTPGVEPERIAAARGGQRIFAVMVGISDYGGTTSDLSNTDEDARKLAESLARAGVLNPASVVLTNAEGTRDGVRDAFARVAAQAGPDDTFLFFYSGHGSQIDTDASPTEPDGRNETLTLRDGELTDDELAEMFATLNTRLAMLILDSCFSGGFARDVVNRPGVMGIFSSEEDLTSLVAEKFEAGGYLAHFVRSGISGEADSDGDSIVSAGELATYLRVRFNSPDVGMLSAETTDGQRNYQNLVIDRGGVQVNDVLVRLSPATDH